MDNQMKMVETGNSVKVVPGVMRGLVPVSKVWLQPLPKTTIMSSLEHQELITGKV